MDYLEWNNLIAAQFFRPEMAGRRIHLYVTEEVLNSLGNSSSNLQDFVSAVKAGPTWITKQGLCQRALQSMRGWRERGLDYPPYIGYLALFVLAAGIEGDFAPHAYYPRLRTLLGEGNNSGQYQSFEHMLELWDDLERWSNKDKAGELGVFYTNITGGWIHVGIPKAQTLLTENERKALPDIFIKAELDPSSPPPDEELAFLIAKSGHYDLRPRILELLERNTRGDEEQREREALIAVIVDELRSWDGTSHTINNENEPHFYGALRLCCVYDPIAERAKFTIRCKIGRDFPQDGFLLSVPDQPDQFNCEELTMGWSSNISLGGKPFDASLFDWHKGVCLIDSEQEWRFRLPAAPIRVFISGSPQGLPGFVETRQLSRDTPFFLAVRDEYSERIERWGRADCKNFEKLPVLTGLPEGWQFFRSGGAYRDGTVRHEFPALSLPSTLRLAFDGGIRVSKGNTFFKFAPPRLLIQGWDTKVQVTCNDKLLTCESEGIYRLPIDLLAGVELVIKAQGGDEIIKRLLYLEENFSLPNLTTSKRFDYFGSGLSESENQTSNITGAIITGDSMPPFEFNPLIQFSDKGRIIFIGRETGQIVYYPSQPFPTDWSPVWAITLRRTGQAVFCGTDISKCEPHLANCGDRKKLKQWKKVLWYTKKKIAPPSNDKLRSLWLRYCEVARHV